jgi:hypothetical protein
MKSQSFFESYQTLQFQKDMAIYADAHPDDSECKHCQAPLERRARVEPGDARQFPRKFALAWYGLTLLEQVIFRHFPDQHSLWIKTHPDLKLPVAGSGMGCVKVVPPHKLVKFSPKEAMLVDFAKHFADEFRDQLQNYSIAPSDFVDALEKDPAFKQADERCIDALLFKQLKILCGQKSSDPQGGEATTPQETPLHYLDSSDDSLNLIEAIEQMEIHYVAFAQPGLTKAAALAEFAPGVGRNRAMSFFHQINRKGETGTLLPKRHLTLLPTPKANSAFGMNQTVYCEDGYKSAAICRHIEDALKAHREYARCNALYFDFREGPVDQKQYLECLEQCLSDIHFKEGTTVTTWKTQNQWR